MAVVRESKETARISTLSTYNRVKAIPELNLPALHREHSAGSRSIASTNSASPSEKLGISGIPSHEPCFITKRPGYSLEKVHLVNAARKDKTLKLAVEAFLRTCNVISAAFNLNSSSNLIPLDRTLHYTLDRLGFIAITCSKATLDAMLTLVKEENTKYDQVNGDYTRVFNRFAAPFSNVKYEMVILHPDHFLPIGSGIVMHTQDPVDSSHVAPKLYMVGSDGALREGRASTSERFPMFSAPNLRADEHSVNPLLVITNAAMAFRRFRGLGLDIQQHLSPEYTDIIDATIELADAIYHPPLAKVAASTYCQIISAMQSRGGSHNEDADTDIDDDSSDDFGTNGRGGPAGHAGRHREAMKFSRFGKEIRDPGPNASDEEIRDFCYYILSGRDHPLTSHDEAILESIGLYSNDPDGEDGAEDDDEGHDSPGGG